MMDTSKIKEHMDVLDSAGKGSARWIILRARTKSS